MASRAMAGLGHSSTAAQAHPACPRPLAVLTATHCARSARVSMCHRPRCVAWAPPLSSNRSGSLSHEAAAVAAVSRPLHQWQALTERRLCGYGSRSEAPCAQVRDQPVCFKRRSELFKLNRPKIPERPCEGRGQEPPPDSFDEGCAVASVWRSHCSCRAALWCCRLTRSQSSPLAVTHS